MTHLATKGPTPQDYEEAGQPAALKQEDVAKRGPRLSFDNIDFTPESKRHAVAVEESLSKLRQLVKSRGKCTKNPCADLLLYEKQPSLLNDNCKHELKQLRQVPLDGERQIVRQEVYKSQKGRLIQSVPCGRGTVSQIWMVGRWNAWTGLAGDCKIQEER